MGDLRQLFPPSEIRKPYGQLIRCAHCLADVDIIEIELTAPMRMRPDVCGQCLAAGHDPEPLEAA